MRQGTAFWIERDDCVWLVRRPGTGMLGGMRGLPDDGWSARGDGCGEAPLSGAWQAAGVVRHVFTHFTVELGVAVHSGDQRDPSGDPAGDGEWWPLARLEDAGLPTLFARAAQLVLANR